LADALQNPFGIVGETRNVVTNGTAALAIDAPLGAHHHDGLQTGPIRSLLHILQKLRIGKRPALTNLNASMSFLDRAIVSMRHLLELFDLTTVEQIFQFGIEFPLVL